MIRLIGYFLIVALIASGLAWLADRPGTLEIVWQGYTIETSVFRAAVILAALVALGVFLWSLATTIWQSPAIIGGRLQRKRRKKGLDALSSGMIAVGAGDATTATRYALQARKSLPHEPLTQLLRAQAAQLSGDRATARRIYESMLSTPETEQLGLRGLYLEAEREGAGEAARQYAERAMRTNPQLEWSSSALFDLQCRNGNWSQAIETLTQLKRSGVITKADADRRRAVLLTAQARDIEESEADKALAMASEAHTLAPDLIPAAVIAGRIQASRGNTAKAAKILQKTWKLSPHPEIAEVYAFARIGDSTRDRYDRVKQLAMLNPHSIESPVAVATAAIDARLFTEARNALRHLVDEGLTQRVATLMAKIEAGESGDRGKVRGWLARAVNAARDPVWMADGTISERWEPVSPVTGKLDAYAWRVPSGSKDHAAIDLEANRIEELLAIASSQQAATVVNDEVGTPPSHGPAVSDATAQSAQTASSASPLISEDVEDAEAVTVRPTTPASSQSGKPRANDAKPDAEQNTSAVAAGSGKPTTTTDKGVANTSEATVDNNDSASDAKSSNIAAQSAHARPANDQETTKRSVVSTDDRPRSKSEPARPDYSAAETRSAGKTEAKAYVSPRAPDDPGPDLDDDDLALDGASRGPFRTANS